MPPLHLEGGRALERHPGSDGQCWGGSSSTYAGVPGGGWSWALLEGVLGAPTLLALAQLPTAAVSASSLEGLDGMELDELPTQVTLRFCGSLTQMWVL